MLVTVVLWCGFVFLVWLSCWCVPVEQRNSRGSWDWFLSVFQDSGLPSSLVPVKPQPDDCIGPREPDLGHLQEGEAPHQEDWSPTSLEEPGQHGEDDDGSSIQISEALNTHFYYSNGVLRPRPHSNAILLSPRGQLIWTVINGWRALKVDLLWSWTCDRLLWGELCPYGTSPKHWDYVDWRLAATTCLHSCIDNDLILCKWMFVLYTLTALGNRPQALPERWCVFFSLWDLF